MNMDPTIKRTANFQAVLQSIFQFVRSRTQGLPPGPCDGSVLRLHYRGAFYFALAGFLTVWYGWYNSTGIIHCVLKYNSDRPIREDYQNICLSYPFVIDSDGQRRYLLFYRWIHWTLLFLAMLFYSPRKLSKSLANPKANRIIEELAQLSPRYDQVEKECVYKVFYYMTLNLKTHNGLYFKYLGVNLFALVVDCGILRFLDFIFHGRFLFLIPQSYPFTREASNFSDYLSQTFPPFAECLLNDEHKILYGREEGIGCHLTYMELYEKIFFILWWILIVLIVAALVHILFLLCLLLPFTWPYVLRPSKPLNTIETVATLILKLSRNIRVGDVYLLYRIKHHMNHARFYELLLKLNDPNIIRVTPQPKIPESEILKVKPDENHIKHSQVSGNMGSQALRNRIYKESFDPSSNSQIHPHLSRQMPANQNTGNGHLTQHPGKVANVNSYQGLHNKIGLPETSILIE